MPINRFSKPQQVAEFNPLSTEQIMTVPLSKEKLEGEQKDQANLMLEELYNTRATAADAPGTNQLKDEMEAEMSALVDDIATNGVSIQNTNKLRALKNRYSKELSASGKIGQANAYVGLQSEAKKEFMARKEIQGYGSDVLNRYWDISTENSSAFGKDGEFKTDFDHIGMPNFITAQDSLIEASKVLGVTGTYKDGRIMSENNFTQVQAAMNSLLAKYANPNSQEYRTMIAQGKTYADIEEELWHSAEMMRTGKIGSITPKAVKPAKAATAAQQKAKAAANESLLQKSSTIMMAKDQFVNGEKLEDIDQLQNYAANNYREYLRTGSDEAKKAYLESEQQARRLEDAIVNDYPEVRNVRDKMVEQGEKLPKDLQKYLDPSKYDIEINDGKWGVQRISDGVWVEGSLSEEDRKKLKMYAKAEFEYENQISNKIKEGQVHEILEAKQVVTTLNDDAYKVYEKNFFEKISNNPTAFKVINVIRAAGPKNSLALFSAAEEDFEQRRPEGEGEEIYQTDNMALLNGAEDFRVTKFVPATAYDQPKAEITFTVKEKKGDKASAERKVTMVVEPNDVPGGVGQAAFGKDLSDIGNVFLTEYAKSSVKRAKYGNIITAPSSKKTNAYINDSELKEHFQRNPGSKGHSLLGSNKFKIDIYKDKEGTYRVQKGEDVPFEDGTGSSMQSKDLKVGDVVQEMWKTTQDITEMGAYVMNLIYSDKDYPQWNEGLETLDDYRNRARGFEEAKLEELKNSGKPFTVNNYFDIFNILD